VARKGRVPEAETARLVDDVEDATAADHVQRPGAQLYEQRRARAESGRFRHDGHAGTPVRLPEPEALARACEHLVTMPELLHVPLGAEPVGDRTEARADVPERETLVLFRVEEVAQSRPAWSVERQHVDGE
jgi:hypothetical protein